MSESDSSSFGRNENVDSNDEKEGTRLDDDSRNNIEASNISTAPKQVVTKKSDDFNEDDNFPIESNDDNKNREEKKNNLKDSLEEINNGKKEEEQKKEDKEDKIEDKKEKEEINEEGKERTNISSKYSNLNKGNELKKDKKKDVIHIEIDKEKTSQKKYTVYQLNLINDNSNKFNNNLSTKNEKKILCYRRYKDFEKFYNILKIRYPQCIFSRLSQKNYIKSKVQDDPVFNEIRRKELQYFINKLYYHDQIGKSEEFKQFLYFATFDEEYFNNLPKKYFYPECEKAKNNKGYFSMGMDKFSSYFSKPKDYKKSELEKEILNREKEFENKDIQYNNLLKEIKVLYETAEEEAKEYKILSNNLLYLKDNSSTKYAKNENEYNKIKFNELINLNQNFSEILENNTLELLTEIIDQLNYCILDVQGINRAIKRYIEFIDKFKEIQEINVKNKYIMEEKEKAKNDKNEFEKSLYDDIQKYDKEKSQIYEEIIESIIKYLKNVNENNDEAFQNSNFIN